MFKIGLSDIFLSHGRWSLKLLKILDYSIGSAVAFILSSQKPSSCSTKKISKILIIRPGGIGDAVFLLPILKGLRDKGVLVDILCEKRNAEVFSSQGYSVYLYNRPKSLGQTLRNVYDVVIDTEQWHYLSAIVSYFVKAEYKIGFGTRPLRAKLFNKQVMYGAKEYELENFLRLFEEFLPALGQEIKNINNCFDVSMSAKERALQQIPANIVVVFLGGSIALRRFSKQQLLDIIRGLLLENIHPVLLGGNDVLLMASWLVKEINDQRILNYVGKTSLIESAAFIHRSQRFIGPDSGLMHLACAVGTPVKVVFGPGHLEKWQPKGDQHKIITERVSCSPCTRFGYTIPSCQGTYHCVKNIRIEG